MSLLKILIILLGILMTLLQHRLWYGDGSLQQVEKDQQRLEMLKKQVQEKKQRNEQLYAEVLDLRKGDEAIEERARYELGMIKKNETFFQVIE